MRFLTDRAVPAAAVLALGRDVAIDELDHPALERRADAEDIVDREVLDELAPAYARFGYQRERMGADTVNAVPHSHYQTRDGAWVGADDARAALAFLKRAIGTHKRFNLLDVGFGQWRQTADQARQRFTAVLPRGDVLEVDPNDPNPEKAKKLIMVYSTF